MHLIKCFPLFMHLYTFRMTKRQQSRGVAWHACAIYVLLYNSIIFGAMARNKCFAQKSSHQPNRIYHKHQYLYLSVCVMYASIDLVVHTHTHTLIQHCSEQHSRHSQVLIHRNISLEQLFYLSKRIMAQKVTQSLLYRNSLIRCIHTKQLLSGIVTNKNTVVENCCGFTHCTNASKNENSYACIHKHSL